MSQIRSIIDPRLASHITRETEKFLSIIDRLEQRLNNEAKGNHPQDSVVVSPIPVTSGQQVTVRYNGLLPNNGAGSVYMHAGYGDNQNKWDNISDIKMNPTGEGWEKTFEVKGLSRLDFCFKDDTNNWDSNNGRNWSYEIKSREQSEFLQ